MQQRKVNEDIQTRLSEERARVDEESQLLRGMQAADTSQESTSFLAKYQARIIYRKKERTIVGTDLKQLLESRALEDYTDGLAAIGVTTVRDLQHLTDREVDKVAEVRA